MLALVISTIFTASSPSRRFTSAQAAMISSKLRYVVGSPSPEKAMSFSRRNCGGVSLNFGVLEQLAAGHQPQHVFELRQQLLGLDEPRLALRRPIDLAIDAVEVADLVRIQVHPDRDPLAPPRLSTG